MNSVVANIEESRVHLCIPAFFYGGAVSAQIVFYKDPALMFRSLELGRVGLKFFTILFIECGGQA